MGGKICTKKAASHLGSCTNLLQFNVFRIVPRSVVGDGCYTFRILCKPHAHLRMIIHKPQDGVDAIVDIDVQVSHRLIGERRLAAVQVFDNAVAKDKMCQDV